MAPAHAVDGGGVRGKDGQLSRVSRRGRLEGEERRDGGGVRGEQ